MNGKKASASGFTLKVTDDSLFGGRVKNHSTGCKCMVCGTPKIVRKIGRLITTNIESTIGACGNCLMRGLA